MSLKIYNDPISQNNPHFIENNNNTILIGITYIVVIICLALFKVLYTHELI